MPAEAAKATKEESTGCEKLGIITVDSERSSGPGRGAPPGAPLGVQLWTPAPVASRHGCSCGPELCRTLLGEVSPGGTHSCLATCARVPTIHPYLKPQAKRGGFGSRALVLIGFASVFCADFISRITAPSKMNRQADNHPAACPPQWLPVFLASSGCTPHFVIGDVSLLPAIASMVPAIVTLDGVQIEIGRRLMRKRRRYGEDVACSGRIVARSRRRQRRRLVEEVGDAIGCVVFTMLALRRLPRRQARRHWPLGVVQ